MTQDNFSDHFELHIRAWLGHTEPSHNPPSYYIPRHCYADIGLAMATSYFSFNIPSRVVDYAEKWLESFSHIIDAYRRRGRQKRMGYPFYYTSHTMHLLNKLHTCERSHERKPSIRSTSQLTFLRSEVSESIELDVTLFIEGFSSIKRGTSNCYKLIRALKNERTVPSSILYDDVVLSDPLSIANSFNSYFASVFTPVTDHFEDFGESAINEIVISDHDVEMALRRCSGGSGPDDIPGNLVSHISSSLCIHVRLLFQNIVTSCVYPSSWKFSHVSPIFKSGDRVDVKCYRPISILPKL